MNIIANLKHHEIVVMHCVAENILFVGHPLIKVFQFWVDYPDAKLFLGFFLKDKRLFNCATVLSIFVLAVVPSHLDILFDVGWDSKISFRQL